MQHSYSFNFRRQCLKPNDFCQQEQLRWSWGLSALRFAIQSPSSLSIGSLSNATWLFLSLRVLLMEFQSGMWNGCSPEILLVLHLTETISPGARCSVLNTVAASSQINYCLFLNLQHTTVDSTTNHEMVDDNPWRFPWFGCRLGQKSLLFPLQNAGKYYSYTLDRGENDLSLKPSYQV